MDLAERLKAHAEATDRSLHSTIVLALKEYVAGLDDEPRLSPETVKALRGAWDSEALTSQFSEPMPNLSRFKCPVHGCEFRAGSDKARCPDHGRVVVLGA